MTPRRLSFLSVLAFVSLAGTAAYATASTQAATYELSPDPLTPGTVSTSPTITVGAGTTVDDFTFSLMSAYNTASTGLFFELPTFGYEISSADLSLYAGTPSAPGAELADTGTFDPATSSKTLGAVLGIGDYFVQSTVTVPSGETGAFSVAATVSAAPEPSVWLLMMLGVGLVGLALRSAGRKLGISAPAVAA